MPSSHHETELRDALNELEQRLEIPIVPGEMENWLRDVHASCCQLNPVLLERIDLGHGELLREIAREDPSLVPRVEQMEQEDEALIAAAAEMERSATKLLDAARQVEPHETKLEGHVQNFTNDALQFILRVRKQESALATWYQEAFMRDRGVVD